MLILVFFNIYIMFFFEKNIKKGIKFLSQKESTHCCKVLRMNSGDQVTILDGEGGKYFVRLEKVTKNLCTFSILERLQVAKKIVKIHLVIAPTKNIDRMAWMTEKLCEIGVDEISFIKTRFSERKTLKIERLENKAIEAIKQSGNPFKPIINEMIPIESFFKRSFLGQRFIAHINHQLPYLEEKILPNQSVTILIGPEGDFDKNEIQKAHDFGYQSVSLEKQVLRTETAGIISCSIVNLVNRMNK